MDLVVSTNRKPHSGETVMGDSFTIVPGGKGANQAVAAARLGAEVYMIGCVGRDLYGDQIIDNLKKNHVHTEYIQQITTVSSGTAHITLEPNGTNSIIVVQGANLHVTPHHVEKARSILEQVDFVLIQQEIPEETVEYVSDLCHQLSIPLILNPAPARSVTPKILQYVNYITPNEHEGLLLSDGKDVSRLIKKYPQKAIITEGERGVSYYDGIHIRHVLSYKVNVVDTTGAGDTFNGAFAVALSEGKGIEESLRFANAAASLSVTKFGAQGGMPNRNQVENILSRR
jgi:ribokinase